MSGSHYEELNDRLILVVEDDTDALSSLMRSLGSVGRFTNIKGAVDAESAKNIIISQEPAVIVMDLSLNDELGVDTGFELLEFIVRNDSLTRVTVLTGHGSVEYGIRALSIGASSFLAKGSDIQHLSAVVRDQLRQHFFLSELKRLQSQENEKSLNLLIAGDSEQTKKLKEEILFLSKVPQPIFITGETGVGKSHVAKMIHTLGKGEAEQFLTFAPTIGQLDLTMSELFGHKKGSFTGAHEDREGLFQIVGGGTLFFDEVDELPNDVQVALLRVIQERVFKPRGAKKEIRSEARLIFASNCDPEEAQNSGKLRKDLFHRAAHLRVHIPPLRERPEDIVQLAQYFVRKVSDREQLSILSIDQEVLEIFMAYSFPGNVRELEAVLETACYRASFDGSRKISKEHIQLNTSNSKSVETHDFRTLVDNYQRFLIEDALSRHQGNQVRAAEELRLDRSTMRRILSRMRN